MILRNARIRQRGEWLVRDVALSGDRVAAIEEAGALAREAVEADLAGRALLPGLVNAHDHLDFASFPPLGDPPYANVYEWSAAVDAGAGDARVRDALAVPLADRLFLGGLRNLLSGVTAVAHHNPFHRSLARADFPVQVLARYSFAHSPGLTPGLRRTYRTTDRRIPWMVHAAEGTDVRAAAELQVLVDANLLRQNTVIVHGIGLSPDEGARLAEAGACLVWCPESNRLLYGATAPVAALRAAGVRIGLGSDSPVSGVRDALSNLAAARAEGVLSDDDLLDLATRGSAEVSRLPVGELASGARADLLAAESAERLLAGDRRAVELVLRGGEALYGEATLLQTLAPNAVALSVDGAPRRLARTPGSRALRLLGRWPALRRVAWIQGLTFA